MHQLNSVANPDIFEFEKNKSAMNPITCRGLVSLEWIRLPSDRLLSGKFDLNMLHVNGKLLTLERKKRFKNIQICADRALVSKGLIGLTQSTVRAFGRTRNNSGNTLVCNCLMALVVLLVSMTRLWSKKNGEPIKKRGSPKVPNHKTLKVTRKVSFSSRLKTKGSSLWHLGTSIAH